MSGWLMLMQPKRTATAMLDVSDAATRARALDPTCSFIVQAPAGSGKTELLTQRYLCLLAHVEHPEQVLAITFTRKAAAEMRNRILLALEAGAQQTAPSAAHERQTWELARAVRAVDAQRDWRLMHHPARLRIQTIDALSASLARRLPVLSGTGAALEPSDDPWPLYEEACERLIERLGDGSIESLKLEALITHLGNRVDRLVELLVELLSKRDQWLHPVMRARASANRRATVECALREVVRRHLTDLCKHVPESLRQELWQLTVFASDNLLRENPFNGARQALLEACLRRPQKPPGSDSEDLTAWHALLTVFFKQDDQPYRRVTVQHGFPRTAVAMKDRMEQMLAELADQPQLCEQLTSLRTLPCISYAEEQWQILEALLLLLPVAVAELQLVFQTHGRTDYAEGSLRALRALGTPDDPTDLALVFDYRLQHILVDEFQDTSFTQLDLLERLTAGWTAGDGRTLFCVGDPMQSIYRFRQAEVGLFLELQQRGLRNVSLESLTLSANFRSERPIIDWTNRVFPRVLSAEDDPEQGAVKYSPSVATKPGETQGVYIHPGIASSPAAEAARVIAIVRQALAGNEPGNVAILVAARSHVSHIAAALAAAGIEFQAVEIESLRDRPVVQDLMALTRALVHLADRTAWLAVLRAPWCGLTLADLYALAATEPRATINQLLSNEQAVSRLSDDGRSRAGRTSAVLRKALAERGRYSLPEWVERTWTTLGGPATLSTLQDLEDAGAFFKRLMQIEHCGDLEDAARLESQLENLFARPRSGSAARVEVMTIHKAKGLEFETVILPALDRWTRREDRVLLRWTRIAGIHEGLILAPLMAEGANPDPIYRWLELLETQRTARERGRLLYVAATRARRHLHLLGNVEVRDGPEGRTVVPPRSGSMLCMLWNELRPTYEEALNASTEPTGAATFTTPGLLRRFPSDWVPPAADPAFAPNTALVAAIVSTDRPEFVWVSETGRRVGTLVHRELERMTRNKQALPMALEIVAARPRLVAELVELGVPPCRCNAAVDRVITAIQNTLDDPRGRWLLGIEQSISETESELALSGVVDGVVIEGVIDRTFVDSDGTRWIVDFKTSTHEGGGLEKFLVQEVERYRAQLVRYAKLIRLYKPDRSVKAALYFPLLRTWRKVSV